MAKTFISDKTTSSHLQNHSLKSNLDLTNTKLQLKEEELDISKEKVQTGEVNIYKEIINEEKTITVSVVREELVIEKQIFNGKEDSQTNTIRIPISEEHIEIIKHPVVLENVDIYNKEFQDIKQIESTLKKEKLSIKTTGDAKVIDNQQKDTFS